MHQHVHDTVVILEEGNLPNPWCPQCYMLLPCSALNGRHLATAQCTMGGGAEEKAVSGGGIEGELGEGLSGLWKTFGKCDGVQVSGKGDDGG